VNAARSTRTTQPPDRRLADADELRARRRRARRRQRVARIDLGLGVGAALILILITPGLAISGLVAALVLVACMASFVIERRRRDPAHALKRRGRRLARRPRPRVR
jgi:Flp pilus assembly protein TadB